MALTIALMKEVLRVCAFFAGYLIIGDGLSLLWVYLTTRYWENMENDVKGFFTIVLFVLWPIAVPLLGVIGLGGAFIKGIESHFSWVRGKGIEHRIADQKIARGKVETPSGSKVVVGPRGGEYHYYDR